MTIAILQTLFAALACYGLWRAWRALTEHSNGRGRASQIVTAGFLIRAFASQLLFWISWLRLPVARSLQVGNGFWFFATDGLWYLDYAHDLIAHGPKAIAFISANYASRIFTQWFTLLAAACGLVASTAILFNCVLYLATCALIFRIGRRNDRARDFALAAMAFGPATILWSLQLLKDTFFVFLIVAMVAIWSEWQKLWRGDHVLRRVLSIAVCAVAMWYAVYAIAGTRWYAGAIVAAASLLFLGLVANLPRPRFAASAVAVLLFFTLGQAFLIGGDFDVPLQVRTALDVRAIFHPKTQAETAKRVLMTARRGFETTAGNTRIVPGPALVSPAPIPTSPQRAEAELAAALPVPTKHISAGLLQPAEKVVTPPPMIAAAPAPAPAPISVPAPAPAPVYVPVAAPVPVPAPVPARISVPARASAPVSVPAPVRAPISVPARASAPIPVPAPASAPAVAPAPTPVVTATIAPVVTATVAPVATETIAPVVTETVAPVAKAAEPPQPRAKAAPTERRTPSPAKPRVIAVAAAPERERERPPVQVKAVPIAPPVPIAPAVPVEQSLVGKIATDAVAMFVPHVLGQAMGLVRIGGGRGFWLFADLDTVIFDLIIFLALAMSLRAIVRRERRVTPLFVLVLLVFAGLTGPMIYTVTNFGTLFRLRDMVYVLAAMLPLTLDLRTPAPAPDESR